MAVGYAAFQFSEIGVVLSWVLGVTAFLLFSQFHSLVSRARERVLLETELTSLQRANQIISEELEGTQLRMRTMVKTTQVQADEHNDQIIAEVRLLETLVQQMRSSADTEAQISADAIIEKVNLGVHEHDGSIPNAAALEDVFDQLSESELFEVIQGSLNDNRIDIYVQPIVSLPQRKIRYFESFTRLRTDEGKVIRPKQYIHIAESTGLVSVIDNLLLFRCVQIVRQLSKREKEIGLFCNISGHSLKDQSFFPQFLDFMRLNAYLSSYLIFEFSQQTIEECGPVEKANMRRLADLGFSFSMDNINSFDLNLGELRELSFQFAKVSPNLLFSALPHDDVILEADLQSIPAGQEDSVLTVTGREIDIIDDIEVFELDSFVSEPAETDRLENAALFAPQDKSPNIHAADFKELLTRYGIDLIVEKIETERQAIDVVELDVDYGQGYLFGEPRPVREPDEPDELDVADLDRPDYPSMAI